MPPEPLENEGIVIRGDAWLQLQRPCDGWSADAPPAERGHMELNVRVRDGAVHQVVWAG